MNTKVEKAKNILKKYHQDELIDFMQGLEDSKKEILADSILHTDLEYATDVFQTVTSKKAVNVEGISPMKAIVKENLSPEERNQYYEIGKKAIQDGEYAVVTVAGGQGTRLGHEGPKGTYQIHTVQGTKYLFQILCETLQEANTKFEVEIPWYIMTSDENDEQTQAFFKQHHYFGYNPDKIHFFKQSKMPLMTQNGQLLVGKDYKIKEASDGHGSIFYSMKQTGVIKELEKQNIKWIFTCGVDNVLVKMVDPYLLGLSIAKNCKLGTKSLIKNSPAEKIGVICKQNKKIKVIEYSELPEDMAKQTNQNGELLFGEAHVMFNLFSLEAIEKIAKEKLPYHIAFKKSDYLDKQGNLVKPEKANAYKFESFIFDSFELFDDIAILRGNREAEFAPIKNATGVDSAETATDMYNAYWEKKK